MENQRKKTNPSLLCTSSNDKGPGVPLSILIMEKLETNKLCPEEEALIETLERIKASDIIINWLDYAKFCGYRRGKTNAEAETDELTVLGDCSPRT
ncbi:hypothetical protein [Paenibacillus alkalitolerans]|uniref:hypothetical protein n=1 Tax=Paenibacillus alkalitolerans TaxID=2799335 RepID=UPI0018F35004|nr:hypothetical protein [Paenibacillus alkalitolerans]